MKNRTEEYWELIGELAQPPQKLEGSVQRARKRARRAQLLRKLVTPAATLASAAACFVLMVNAFPTFALACSGVPIIRELTAAVAFSPSLSAAVAHDYVQYIGQSQTVDGVTVNLEYAIVDDTKMVFFYSADGVRLHTSPDLTGENGEYPIGGYGVSYQQSEKPEDGLSSVTFDFVSGIGLPDRFTMEMFFIPEPLSDQMTETWEEAPATAPLYASVDDGEPDLWGDPREDPGVLRFTFDVALDSSRIAEPVTVPVGRWVELDGQRILVDRLEYTPTRTVLYLSEDTANTAWLKSLKFWFEDQNGTRYDNIDGSISSIGAGNTGSKSYLTYYFQSFYYDQKELTLFIDKTEWLDKNAPRVFVDLTTGQSTGLPDGAQIGEIIRNGENVRLEILSPVERQYFSQTFDSTCWDPEGGEHSWNQMSFTTVYNDASEEIASKETLYLNDYPWDAVELELLYTSVSEYDQPIRVLLAPASGK